LCIYPDNTIGHDSDDCHDKVFNIIDITDGHFHIRTSKGLYIAGGPDHIYVDLLEKPTIWSKFLQVDGGHDKFGFRTYASTYLQVLPNGKMKSTYTFDTWERFALIKV